MLGLKLSYKSSAELMGKQADALDWIPLVQFPLIDSGDPLKDTTGRCLHHQREFRMASAGQIYHTNQTRWSIQWKMLHLKQLVSTWCHFPVEDIDGGQAVLHCLKYQTYADVLCCLETVFFFFSIRWPSWLGLLGIYRKTQGEANYNNSCKLILRSAQAEMVNAWTF